MKKFLGIIGGLGSQASCYFYETIINKTKVAKDQDHINMIIYNHASIPDRTQYILGKSSENPLKYLKQDILELSNMGAKIIAIPCNTACYFHNELQKVTNIPILNLVEDAVEYLKHQKIEQVIILATTGTIKSSLYQNACQKYNIKCIILDDITQKKVMHIIYNNIKKGKRINMNYWHDIISYNTDVSTFILACTELSMLKKVLKLDSNFIDPLEIEAEKIINIFGKEFKK